MEFTEKVLRKIKINSVVHVGAHLGQEVSNYKFYGISKIVLFEPQQYFYNILSNKFKNDNQIKIFNVALGNKNKITKINISNNDGASSSLLTPKKHLEVYPEIDFKTEETVQVKKMSDFNFTDFDLLVVDTQGYELNVLEGCEDLLRNFKYLIIEINLKELYEGCPTVKNLDDYLTKYNFIRIKTSIHSKKFFGDALYVQSMKFNALQNYFYSLKASFFISNFYTLWINTVHLDYWKELYKNLKLIKN